jgi:hypothetical protein
VNPIGALAESSGWAVAALTAVTVALPYLVRPRFPAPAAYLERLRPHYWIGATIAGLTLLHAGLAMSAGPAPGGAGWAVGIWMATGAMLLVFGQVSLGLGLARPGGVSPAERVRRRRLHFLAMTLLVAAGAAHVALNGPVTRALLAHVV